MQKVAGGLKSVLGHLETGKLCQNGYLNQGRIREQTKMDGLCPTYAMSKLQWAFKFKFQKADN